MRRGLARKQNITFFEVEHIALWPKCALQTYLASLSNGNYLSTSVCETTSNIVSNHIKIILVSLLFIVTGKKEHKEDLWSSTIKILRKVDI